METILKGHSVRTAEKHCPKSSLRGIRKLKTLKTLLKEILISLGFLCPAHGGLLGYSRKV